MCRHCQYVRVDSCCHYVYEVNKQLSLLHEDTSLYILDLTKISSQCPITFIHTHSTVVSSQ